MVQGLFPYDYWDTVSTQLERGHPGRDAGRDSGRVSVGQAMLCSKDGKWLLVSMLSAMEVQALVAMLELQDRRAAPPGLFSPKPDTRLPRLTSCSTKAPCATTCEGGTGGN